MSLYLSGSKPEGVYVSTTAPDGTVHLGGPGISVDISMTDFLFAAQYVLTNAPLVPNDPRLIFVDNVRFMKEVEGFLKILTRS